MIVRFPHSFADSLHFPLSAVEVNTIGSSAVPSAKIFAPRQIAREPDPFALGVVAIRVPASIVSDAPGRT